MWWSYAVMLVGGVLVLGAGGECVVRGATRLARAMGVSSLVVGLTVVAFGTSAPEAAVTITAAVRGVSELAVGNVVGSNIANILLIIGLVGVMSPLRVSTSIMRVDGVAMIVVSVLFLAAAMANARVLSREVGALFVAGLVLYTVLTYYLARGAGHAAAQDRAAPGGLAACWWFNAVLVVAGIAGLVWGADMMVAGASGIARLLGVSEHVIGLTIVAIGTSLPELATVIAAARHGEPDLAVGNVVGSNIFNVLLVAGLAAAIRPLAVPAEIVAFDAPLMIGVAVLFYAMVLLGRLRVTRVHGVVYLLLYAAYLAWRARGVVSGGA